MRVGTGDEQRQRYLAGYHNQRPAITGRLLSRADASPYPWLVEPLQEVSGPILDLACGSAPTRALRTGPVWFGVDLSAAELGYASGLGRGPLVRARADALPAAGQAVAAVCAAMCLPVLTPQDTVLGDLGPSGEQTRAALKKLGDSLQRSCCCTSLLCGQQKALPEYPGRGQRAGC